APAGSPARPARSRSPRAPRRSLRSGRGLHPPRARRDRRCSEPWTKTRTCYCFRQPSQVSGGSTRMTEPPHALVEGRGHALILTLNRPRARNALSGQMLAIMRQAWDDVDADPDIRVAVLTGAGGAFCAGADLKAMAQEPPGDAFGSSRPDLSVIDALLKGR